MTALTFAPNGTQKSSLSNVIEEWFSNDSIRRGNFKYPLTNIREEDDRYIIQLSVPGLSKEAFDIKIDRNQLSIATAKSFHEKVESESYKMQEFHKSSFTKSFHLSDDIDSDKITAKCDNGILSVILPKKEEAKTLPPRSITID